MAAPGTQVTSLAASSDEARRRRFHAVGLAVTISFAPKCVQCTCKTRNEFVEYLLENRAGSDNI